MSHSRLSLALAAAAILVPVSAETLYNGIELSSPWPPSDVVLSSRPSAPAPYLVSPPAVIPIDVGRQLFVDYFLIDRTNLRRTFHRPEPYPGNPVLRPDRPWEREKLRGSAMAFSDGVWYDPADKLFKAWYVAGANTLYATSLDGVHWTKPSLDVRPGTNIVHTAVHRDSSVVWLDQEERDPQRRFKLVYSNGNDKPLSLFYSPDGIHWGDEIVRSLPVGDRSTVFYNPFRRVWVMSLRQETPGVIDRVTKYKLPGTHVRQRKYWENPDLAAALGWKAGELVWWTGADRLDHVRVDIGARNELYNLDANGYESVLLGLFSIWRGQRDRKVADKPDEIAVGFSRDGFHWERPFRETFIPVSEDPQAWNHSNVQSVGGICLVVGDRLYFYMSGRSGASQGPGDNATGLATLRRDGFVSMDAGDAGGTLTTRPVRFRGKYLFVNVCSPQGELTVEALDQDGRVIEPFSDRNCIPLRIDNTLQAVSWSGAEDLSALAGKPVRFRFHLRDGSLYSFWVSPDRSGASHGYVAAGGPGFTGVTDTAGDAIYEHGFAKMILH